MFQGCKAWFSQSVRPEQCRLWVAEGGVIADQKAADYLFSSDASHPDTKRIHRSLDYIEDRITVFHSSYLTANANSEIKNTVPLGHFILPPACLHQEIREKIGCFIWDQVTNTSKLQSSQPEIKSKTEEEEQKTKKGWEKSYSEDRHAPGTLEIGKLPYVPLQDYPASNMMTGYASAKGMKKFLGSIRDFIPGCSGDLAYWIPSNTNMFPQDKTISTWK
ncbi:hypothetical protein JRQ81_006819 [Phrynocephalus forsythii]|uniref:Telomere repeats-binding bouquet formation protein 2 n=1 Tax=Phrynocephalus forsythii TaxID=171643 RepID=A0A9Q1AUG2_9SAUR|nr:hypothetical protein JRQ81_006819 [Phrynocephalus forsythii]